MPDAINTNNRAEAEALLQRMERLPVARWHLRMRGTIGFATFIDAIDFVAIALVLPILAVRWSLSPSQIGLLISASFFGQLIGALTFPSFAEKLGRIPVLAFTVLWFGLAGVGCALSWSYSSLLFMRFLQGIGMGPEPPIAAAYISEIAPTQRRGRFTLLYQLIFGVGLMASGLLGRYIVPHFGWQSIFWIGAIPALVIVPFIYRLPESPRWLISAGKLAKARVVIDQIEKEIVASGKALPPVSDAIQLAPSLAASKEKGHGSWKELFSSYYRRRTVLIWLIWISIGFISWPLTSWLPTIYRTVYHIPVEQALNYGMLNNLTIFGSLVCCALLIDPVGRRKYFFCAFAVAGCALLSLVAEDRDISRLFILSTICLFAISSLNLGVYVYTTELYPTRLRAVGIGICNAWSRIAGMIAPWVIGVGLEKGGLGTVFMLLGGIGVFAAALIGLFGIETRKRVLEEISP